MAVEQSIPELRPIPGFPGYFADRNGGIWSTRRQGRGSEAPPERKKLTRAPNGYLITSLSFGGRHLACNVARFVLLAWVGGPPTPGHEAAHRNGIRTDNRIENLRWSTRQENEADKDRHGTAAKHERHPKAKLTWALVDALRADRAAGLTYKQLSEKYGINLATAHRIVRGDIWRKPNGNALSS